MKRNFGRYLGPTLIDEAQPISAWRIWRLGRLTKGSPIVLTATWKKDWAWVPEGEPTVAACLAEKDPCHISMRPDCDCGLWGALRLTNLLAHGAIALYPTGALGRVHLWGFVHTYEFGVRASMGRPAAVWLGSSAGRQAASDLAARYQIPVELNLPLEVVVDPDLLSPKKVLAAANAYLAGQSFVASQSPRAVRSGVTPAPKIVHHCSGCGAPGRKDRCPKCQTTLAAGKV